MKLAGAVSRQRSQSMQVSSTKNGPGTFSGTFRVLSAIAIGGTADGRPSPGPSELSSNGLGIDPGHQAAEPLADLLDGMFTLATSGRVEHGATDLVLQDPLPRELPG